MGDAATRPAQLTARALAADLDRRLAHVLERAMRRRLVQEVLHEVRPEEAAALLSLLETRAPRGSAGVRDLLREACGDVLIGVDPACELGYEQRRAIYEAATALGEEGAARLLRTLPARDEGELRVPRELAEIPLGRRRSLARGSDERLLELLERDVDAKVIANLLQNPRVREADVVRIAARRPVPASTLEEIFRSPRWATSPRVRTALARNPHCPPGIAVRVVGSLPLAELREMRADPGLHEEARAAVERELARRDPDSWNDG
jgi:hypothetical protein